MATIARVRQFAQERLVQGEYLFLVREARIPHINHVNVPAINPIPEAILETAVNENLIQFSRSVLATNGNISNNFLSRTFDGQTMVDDPALVAAEDAVVLVSCKNEVLDTMRRFLEKSKIFFRPEQNLVLPYNLAISRSGTRDYLVPINTALTENAIKIMWDNDVSLFLYLDPIAELSAANLCMVKVERVEGSAPSYPFVHRTV